METVNESSKRIEELKGRLNSLRVQKAADEKSIERYRSLKNRQMVAELTRYIKTTLDREIAKLEAELKGSGA